MFDEFVRCFNVFRERGLEDSFVETLRCFDLLTDGSLSKIDPSRIDSSSLDPEKIAESRKKGIPLEYIMGRALFMGFSLYCTSDTLIPRDETVLLVEAALGLVEEREENSSETLLIEMGTGCGNIAVAVAMNTSRVSIMASDISCAAIGIARRNVDGYHLGDRISLRCGDLFAPFPEEDFRGKADLIVCNPPYIPSSSLKKLGPVILDNEPILALDGGAYGIDFFQRLIRDSVPFLKEGGALLFEIGAGQEKLVTRILRKNGSYNDIGYYDDGNDIRVISARKKQR